MTDKAMEAATVAVSWALGDCDTARQVAVDAVTAYLAQREADGAVMVPLADLERLAAGTAGNKLARAMLAAARPQNGEG